MADVYKPLKQGQLAASVGTLYTVPSSTQTIIRSIVVINTDSVDRVVDLFMNGTAEANRILGSVAVPFVIEAGERLELNSVMTLAATNTIRGNSDAANVVTINVFGLEIGT